MPTYTERLKLINPDVGACNWDYPLKRNRYILDLVDAQDMNSNFVVDGCEVTAGAGLTVDITSGNVNIAGTVYAVAAGNVAVVAASADPEQFNFVYVDSAGALKVYPTDAMPSGDFAVIALVDTDLTSVLRIGDLRRLTSAEDAARTPVENSCINGTFDIWQRGVSQTTSGYGSDDRWKNDNTGSTKVHSQQTFAAGQTVVPGNPKYYSRTVITSVAGSANSVKKVHRVLDVTKYSGQTVCFSFYAKADAAKDVSIEALQNFGSGGSASVFLTPQKLSLTSAWQKFTLFFDLPSVTGKTIGTNSYATFQFWFDAGSDFNARTDTLGQQSGTFDIAEVGIYESDKELPVRRKTAEETLSDCQPYCWRQSGTFRQVFSAYTASSQVSWRLDFPAKMIKTPSVTLVGSFSYTANSTGGAIDQPSQDGFRIRCLSVAANPYSEITLDGSSTSYALAEAEL